MKELMMVPGIGPAKAGQLVNDHGITSLEDLIEKHDKELIMLPKNVSGALEYALELQERIPREEVELISQFVEDVAKRMKLKVKMITCGSYRRGKADSGDVDILIYHNDDSYPEDTLTKLVDKLRSEKFLIGTLSEGNTKYMGICRLLDDLPARRIDIVYLTKKSLPAALMYFTGSGNLFWKLLIPIIRSKTSFRVKKVVFLVIKYPPIKESCVILIIGLLLAGEIN